MPHELVSKLETLRSRILRQRWVCAVAAVAASMVGAATVLATVDFVLRISDPGLRWMLFICWWAVALLAAYRFAIVPLRKRLTALDVARQVERQNPQFGDRLGSALEFVNQQENDPLAGSVEMRRAVVTEASSAAESLPREAWNRVIDPAPLRKSLATAAIVCGVALLLVFLNPTVARIAGTRLFQPWQSLSWPRIHNLEVVEAPTRLARGQSFEATIADSYDALPVDAQIHYRLSEEAGVRKESFPLQTIGDLLVARRENVQRSFAFRVTGGDDDSMPWREVTVVDPPRLMTLEVTARPPAYTGLPDATLSRHIRVLAGTKLSVAGQASETLRRAEIEVLEESPVPATVDGERMAIESWPTPEELEKPLVTNYRVKLENREGIEGISDSWALRVDPDPPPEVTWQEPASDQFVLANAVVPIRVAVNDNLAIQKAAILYSRENEEEPLRVEIYAGADHPPPQTSYEPEEMLDRRELQFDWELSPLKLEPGTELSVLVEASDYRPAVGRTALPRRIRILTSDEFESRLADRQARIVRELEQALEQQRSAQQRTRQMELDTAAKPAPTRADVDQLATTGLDQRQVGRRLTDPAEGVLRELQALRNDLTNNQIDRPELSQQLKDVEDQLAELGKQQLPQAESKLTDARKSAESLLRKPDEAAKEMLNRSLVDANQAQSEVANTLEQLVGQLQQWSDFQRFAREVARLQQEQGELRRATQAAAAQAAAAPDRAEQAQAERQRLREQQAELARRLDNLQQEMEAASQPNEEQESQAAESIADALEQSRERGTAGKLREATRELQGERLGRAAEVQQQAEQDLQDLLDTLRGRGSRDPEQLAEQLREAQEHLEQMREELAELDRQAQQQSAAETQPQQESLAERVARAARQMLRMGARPAGQSTQQAAEALQQEPNAEEQQQGRDDADAQLAQAQQQLQQQEQKLEQQVAQRKLDVLAKQVDGYIERQRKLLTDTLRLDDAARPTDAKPLATTQQALESAVRNSAEEFSEQPVFEMALGTTASEMRDAAELLAAGNTGRSTQQAEHSALTRLQHIAEVLQSQARENEEKEGQNQANAGDQGGQGGEQQQEPSPLDLAELKMLRLMQAELNQRTRHHEAELVQREDRQRDDPQTVKLAEQQEQLAKLVEEMIERISRAQEERN